MALKGLKKISYYLFVKHRRKSILVLLLFLIWYWFCLPNPLFNVPISLVLEDQNGELLGAKIAADGQWRFPQQDSIPEKFEIALLEFEDRRFYAHPGIDPLGIGRAIIQNIKNARVVSGGSTISMQLIRMAKQAKTRNIFQKLYEIILATRLEIKYSKKEILALYVSNAPFGGNVVGLEAAAWRYFGKAPNLLSWAEAATLAVLPNSPGLIHPGRNRVALLEKRNRLLKRLFEKGQIGENIYELSLEEHLPEKPHPLPRHSPHLLEKVRSDLSRKKELVEAKISTTIDINLQMNSIDILRRHIKILKNNGIHNISAVIFEVETGNVLVYIGNILGTGAEHGEEVDMIRAKRSTGSILKPHLYAMMLDEGKIVPSSIIADIPTHLTGYRPENFHESYDGVVPAQRAIIRSLNVPLVRMLQDYGLEKFHYNLKKWGFHSINQPPQHYGLPLIVGGAEASLWEITNSYCCFARVLNHFPIYDGQYDVEDFRAPTYIEEEKLNMNLRAAASHISASSIWQTFEALQNLERPNNQGGWRRFENSHKVAWKTGTSFGFKDAWAVGVNPKYAVGVWVGNADGEGRPGLIGVQAAAPVLFDLFDILPNSDWFEAPLDEMIELEVCSHSGFAALPICPKDTILASPQGQLLKVCSFHKLIHLDSKKQFLVNSNCYDINQMHSESRFVLPPVEEYYYKSKNPGYVSLPDVHENCLGSFTNDASPLQLIYPKHATKIYIPVDLDGTLSQTIFKAAHRNTESKVFWHLDKEFVGATKTFHELGLKPQAGAHILVLVDELGNRIEQKFEILEKN